MDWLVYGLISALVFSVVSVLDKRMLLRYFPSVRAFNMLVGVTQITVGALVLAAILPFEGISSVRGTVLAFTSGIVLGASLALFFFALSRVDVSRATPLWLTSPIFAALLAMGFLGDRVTPEQWAAIVVVVVGATMLSYNPAPGRRGFLTGIVALALLLAAFTQALGFVINKEASAELTVWTNNGWRMLGFAVGLILVNYRRASVRELTVYVRNRAGLRLMVLTEGVLAPLASLALIGSITTGAIAPVTAVSSTRPLFLLFISTALSTRFWNVLNEPLDRSTLLLKVISTALIVGGTVGLALL
ncbi:MAG: EamA family transporter [Chloroflexota bacterium]|nr:EamA family transporter [Chloroflexota bacterium]